MRNSKAYRFPVGGRRSSGTATSSCCSPIMFILWTLILFWSTFLCCCWYWGFMDKERLTEVATEVETILIKTEDSLLQHAQMPHWTFAHPAPLSSTNQTPEDLHVINTENITPHDKPESSEEFTLSKELTSKDAVMIIFSTDCSAYQDWQTLVLFHSAKLVGQKGTVTRIASGCDEEKQRRLAEMYHKLYGDVYGVHFTPDFKKDAKTNKKYDFYNKPWGLKHWLENSSPPVPDDAIIALLDPDMVLLRPITPQILGTPFIVSRRQPKDEIKERIAPGFPVAQTYGLGAPWTNDNHRHFRRQKICGDNSPCLETEMNFGELHYSVGPPYVVHKQDMVRLAQTWTTFVPRVYENYPYLLAEMYAYSMAAAHERLPHLQLENYMVSNVDSPGEGWPWVDELEEVCVPPVNGIYYPGRNIPTVAHFCQTFRAGDFMFTKRQVPHDIFDCDHDMLLEPPQDLAKATYFIKKGNKEEVKSAVKAKRNSFVVCILYQSVNLALQDFKERMCSGQNTSFAKTVKW